MCYDQYNQPFMWCTCVAVCQTSVTMCGNGRQLSCLPWFHDLSLGVRVSKTSFKMLHLSFKAWNLMQKKTSGAKTENKFSGGRKSSSKVICCGLKLGWSFNVAFSMTLRLAAATNACFSILPFLENWCLSCFWNIFAQLLSQSSWALIKVTQHSQILELCAHIRCTAL